MDKKKVGSVLTAAALAITGYSAAQANDEGVYYAELWAYSDNSTGQTVEGRQAFDINGETFWKNFKGVNCPDSTMRIQLDAYGNSFGRCLSTHRPRKMCNLFTADEEKVQYQIRAEANPACKTISYVVCKQDVVVDPCNPGEAVDACNLQAWKTCMDGARIDILKNGKVRHRCLHVGPGPCPNPPCNTPAP